MNHNVLSTFLALCFLYSCKKNDDIQLSLSIDGNDTSKVVSIPADGESKRKIQLKIEMGKEQGNYVVFNTTNGKLLSENQTTEYDSKSPYTLKSTGSLATCFIKASTTIDDNVYVTANVNGRIVGKTLKFTRVYADSFYVKPVANSYDTTQSVNVEVFLFKKHNKFFHSEIPVYLEAVVDTLNLYTSGLINSSKVENTEKAVFTLENTFQKKGVAKYRVKLPLTSNTFSTKEITITYK